MTFSIRFIVPPAFALALGALAFAPSAAQAQQGTPQAGGTSPAPPGDILTEQEPDHTIASQIIGLAIVDPSGNEVAEVTDLLLDEAQQVVAVVVSVGGFLGIGAKPVALPWETVRVTRGEGGTVAVVELSEEELAEAPRFMTRAEIEAAERARQLQQQQMQGQGAPPPAQ